VTGDRYNFHGNITGSVVGGQHGKVRITNAEPDLDSLQSELDRLRQRIEALDPTTPDLDQAMDSVGRMQAAVDDGDPEAAEEPLSTLEKWSQRLNLALGIAKLGDHVRQWIG
jgi:hypothetical protein